MILTIPSGAHEHIHGALYGFIALGLLNDNFAQGRWSHYVGATTFSGPGYSMQGDTGGKPLPERIGQDAWPTLIIEGGRSQSWNSLYAKAHLWFARSHGQVRGHADLFQISLFEFHVTNDS